MSATLQRDWLKTVDFSPSSINTLELNEDDKAVRAVQERIGAVKPLFRAAARMDQVKELAQEITSAHVTGTLTLVVVNTVKRARDLFSEIATQYLPPNSRAKKKKSPPAIVPLPPVPTLILLHSRFRPLDRKHWVDKLLAKPSIEGAGTICVSTQVVEAGVDISARTLFTELVPWSSLVQRFGRCNRRGEFNLAKDARVVWIDLPAKADDAEKASQPYDVANLQQARETLSECTTGVGPSQLPNKLLPYEHTHVIRCKDIVELFDTTPDLTGNDIDIDRYVREIDETDVRIFWRDLDGALTLEEQPGPIRNELCPAPLGEFKDFAKSTQAAGKIFHRDFQQGQWVKADTRSIYPGQVYLVHSIAGGYTNEGGWDKSITKSVSPLTQNSHSPNDDKSYDDDGLSQIYQWQTIAQHTDAVCIELAKILDNTRLDEATTQCLRDAARWHDWGKAHPIFQDAIKDGQMSPFIRPPEWIGNRFVAKAPGRTKDGPGFWRRPCYKRKHFRHELASAVAVLLPGIPLAAADRDLVAYLIAAHHGKVRLSIRSMPDETKPPNEQKHSQRIRRFARGVWDDDTLPEVDLGGNITAPGVTLSLELMELGLCEHIPFVGQPSWLERTLRLRNTLGPFRLAYLETLLRAADCRASAIAITRPSTSMKEVANA